MPSNTDFSMKIFVGGVELPEYQTETDCYVESNFFTSVSYKVRSEDQVGGEAEVQSWPVTPYQILLTTHPSAVESYYRILVDGHHVKSCSAKPGQSRYIKGFREYRATREFLFSLPGFQDSEKHIENDRQFKIGSITVECYNAQKVKVGATIRDKPLFYLQASKKDCSKITEGKYLMSTTRVGKVIKIKQKYGKTDFWKRESSPRSSLTVKYATAETLQEMGLSVCPVTFPNYTDKPNPVMSWCSSLSNKSVSQSSSSNEKTKDEETEVKIEPMEHRTKDNSVDIIDNKGAGTKIDAEGAVICLSPSKVIVID